ncbi:MAG TPA: hypothetical protein VHX68_03625, partial [Planctomycetaceae bacterium]|nr:hypothetical protein [Planctomycetaceae bacterium]
MTSSSAPAASPERATFYFQKAAAAASTWYDKNGNWIGTTPKPIPRERYWLCFSLYGAGESALADAIVRSTPDRNPGNPHHSFDIFHTNIPASLLCQHESRMADDVKRRLEETMRVGFAIEPGDRRCDFQFHGYNDNMPAKATMCLVLGGERLGDKAAFDHGLWNLRQMRSMLTRRGINSEFNSPTYSPLTIHAMAKIAEYAKNPEAREIALKIEERLWLDVAARFHPGTGVVAGPCSRAYFPGLLAHLSNMASMLWLILGDAVHPSPMELFEPDFGGLVIYHDGDLPFNIAQMSYFIAGGYHVPPKALELLTRKSYPFHAVATLEMGDAGSDRPGLGVRAETFLEKDFALGTANLPFSGAGAYHALYKRVAEVTSFRDVGTVFHRFHINDDVQGIIRTKKDEEGRTSSGEGFIGPYNEISLLQSESTVLLASGPQLSLGGLEEDVKAKPISRLNEMLVFPSHFGGADEVRIGARSASGWSGEAAHGEWIGCRRGRLLLAARALAYTADLGPVRTTLEKINNYEVIRTCFYEGPARIFARFELRRI